MSEENKKVYLITEAGMQFAVSKPVFDIVNELRDEVDELEEEIDKLKGQLEEKTYLYNKLQTESKYVINKQKEVLDKIKEYIKNHIVATETEEVILELLEEIE